MNKNGERRVLTTDTIFATVMSCGRMVYRATYAGMRSVEDVIAALRRAAARYMTGPVTVTLRNSTQGWSMNSAMMRRSAPEGMQLTLF